MEIKKSSKADLEKHRSTWMLLGCVIALTLLFVALEWSTQSSEREQDQIAYTPVSSDNFIPILEIEDTPEYAVKVYQKPKYDLLENPFKVVSKKDIQGMKIEPLELPKRVEEQNVVEYIEDNSIEKEEIPTNEIFAIVEKMPEYPGGMAEMMKYLSQNIKYPMHAREVGIQGRVIVVFVVNKDGSITNPEVVKGVEKSLNQEAIRVITSMPKWEPGTQRGKPVRVRYTLPVVFRLR